MGGIISYANKNKIDDHLPLVPEEIIKFEILTRVPAKSLIRFKCVCKSWKDFLLSDNPDFVKSHLSHTSLDPNNDYLFATKFMYNQLFDIQPFTLRAIILELVGSVNGLVCLYVWNPNLKSVPWIGVWNPVTNYHMDIPPAPSMAASKVLDQHSFSFGFGFDPISNDYKVIYFTCFSYQPLVADVYSCNAGSWVKSDVTCITYTIINTSPTIIKGIPYWYNRRQHDTKHVVIWFDMREEVFKSLPGLGHFVGNSRYLATVNLRDSLAVIVCNSCAYSVNHEVLDVYIFEETCGGCWTKKYSVRMRASYQRQFLHCFRNGDLLFYNSRSHKKLMSVNARTKERMILDSKVMDSTDDTWCTCEYRESLVSVKGMVNTKGKRLDQLVNSTLVFRR